jgi:hypothetical protein
MQVGMLGPDSSLDESDLQFLDNAGRFNDFVQLVGSINVFLRVHRETIALLDLNPDVNDKAIGRLLRNRLFVDASERRLNELAQLARQAAKTALKDELPTAMKKAVWRFEPANCYLCGVVLVTTGNGHDKRSVDHLWPRALGGQSIIENLMPCCNDCNCTKKHDITWAWGPVQSTYETIATANTNPAHAIRLSLGLARLMFAAEGADRSGGGPRTLKEAAKYIGTAIPKLDLDLRRPYTYLELLDLAEESLQ